MKTAPYTRILAVWFFLFLAISALAYYSPEQGRWLNRDPIEEKGGRNLHAFLDNAALMRSDSLGLFGPIDQLPPTWPPNAPLPRKQAPGSHYYGCDKALSGAERATIDSAILVAQQRLQDTVNGKITLPSDLTTDMASCLLERLTSGFAFNCAGRCSPFCWGGKGKEAGWGFPFLDGIIICVDKIKTEGSNPLNTIELLLFHELCHSCNKWGHDDPDNPYKWGAWLTTVLSTPRPEK